MRVTKEHIEKEYTEHYAEIVRFSFSIVKDSALAEDIAQRAFIKLFEKEFDYDVEASKLPWLYVVSRNEAIKQSIRKRKYTLVDSSELGDDNYFKNYEDTYSSPLEEILLKEGQQEKKKLLNKILKKISAREKDILFMRYHDNLSYTDISEKLKLTQGNVGFIIHTAMQKLKTAMKFEQVKNESKHKHSGKRRNKSRTANNLQPS